MGDIIFKTDEYVFSYRVAGVCVENGKVLLQRATNDSGHAFPGGHVALGETNAETLRREFFEEIGAEVEVGALRWVGELFFPWGDRPCHQICLYYDIKLLGGAPRDGSFFARERMEGRDFQIEYRWVPLDEVDKIEVYPPDAPRLLRADGVSHFIYREQ